jgi:ribosomal protein S20
MLLGAAVAVLVLVGAGCGEGPVFFEDQSVLAQDIRGPEKTQTPAGSDDVGRFDPETQKAQEEEEKQRQEEEEKEAQGEKAIQSSADAIDEIGSLINDHNFDEAKKVFDENAHLIKQAADKGMLHDNPKIGELYRDWWDKLKEMRRLLDEEEPDPARKRHKAINALVAAGDCKKAARHLGMVER